LRQYAVFRGRARRSEYWYFVLFLVLVNIVASILDSALFGSSSTGPLGSLVGLAFLVPALAAATRRLHDTDRSGWWQLIVLVPALLTIGLLVPGIGFLLYGLGMLGVLAAGILLLVWLCQRGTPGPNRFGTPPVAASVNPALA
jgi:uncharacterized membrane protein YhaH (DUF805 family)